MAVKTISGSDLVVSLDLSDDPANHNDVVAVGGATNCTINLTQEMIETTNKDSGGKKDFINGVTSWSLDVEAFYTDGTADNMAGETNRPSTLYDALTNGYLIAVKFFTATGVTGTKKYQGWGYITNVTNTGTVGEWGVYSVSIQGTGNFNMTTAV
tara:strand:- start:15211 stop:15675 length:465 start_codon:yes stop_codon:yes gene_type:complete